MKQENKIGIYQKEIAEHEGGLLKKVKTDEERLSDHKNFLDQWERQFGPGLQQGQYMFCK